MWGRKPKKVAKSCFPASIEQGVRDRVLVFCADGHLLACMRASEYKGSQFEAQVRAHARSLRSPISTQ